ncbi:type II toxin-antitoxin system RelE/ParE family toxin [Pelobium manganitolerans]|uniref:type II toxin-antitoxin system RelE/ParE family toxin n=1 Tax=Pelobium manganitolerans TaxID=1842495 RepID=UPI000E71614F|nr:type II toxin-antitoxin system RelE/ParE family toxin [Pelobium manganitolerans]
MNYKIVTLPAVRFDIIDATDFYKEISPKLAKQFLFRIREAKDYILNYPLGFQQKYSNVRMLSLRQFPYQIHYLIDEDAKRIVILAVVHSHRKPTNYLNRQS